MNALKWSFKNMVSNLNNKHLMGMGTYLHFSVHLLFPIYSNHVRIEYLLVSIQNTYINFLY